METDFFLVLDARCLFDLMGNFNKKAPEVKILPDLAAGLLGRFLIKNKNNLHHEVPLK